MGRIKKILLSCASLILLCGLVPMAAPKTVSAVVNPSYLIMDSAFEGSTYSVTQINNLLNSYKSSCISSNNGFTTPDPTGFSGSSYQFGSSVNAGQAIYDISQHYHVNPQVVLATLQKEQSVVTGSAGCYSNTPNSAQSQNSPCGTAKTPCTAACPYSGGCMPIAMSYSCPNYCYAGIEGFGNQISGGTWLLRFAEERSYGLLTGYAGYDSGDETYFYGGPMTPGVRQRSSTDTPISYDGSWTTNDGTSVQIRNGGTASLYTYTPFLSGNTSFTNIFTNWFGSPTSPCYNGGNIPGTASGEHAIPNKLGINHTDNLTLIQPNNTGSTCVEAHTWLNNNYSVWMRHIASNSPVVNPAYSKILTADTNGDGVDEMYLVNYDHTGSGMIEVHGWDSSAQHWVSHIATNHPAVSPSDSEVITADLTGSGHDNFFLVQYRNTASGHLEVHEWSSNLQQWVNHWDTGYGPVDPTKAQIIAADFNGDGKDELYLVQYSGTQSGKIEVHGGITNLGYLTAWPYSTPSSWPVHTATISPAITHVDTNGNPVADVIGADTNGNSQDEPYLVEYAGTGSGRVEIHGWTQNFRQWASHIATSEGQF